MSTRRSKHVATILLLLSAMIVSASYFNIPPSVLGAPTVTLNPPFSPRGAIISVSGTGFSFPNGTKMGHGSKTPVQCTFWSLDGKNVVNTLITSPICNIASSDNSTISGSFRVNVLITTPIPNPYTFIVNMTDSIHTIRAQTTFAVTEIYIHPASGPQGTVVNVTGSLSTIDTSCSFTAPQIIVTSTSLTTTTAPLFGVNSCILGNLGNFSGRFVVDTVGPGPYTVRVTGSSGDFVQTTFTVTAPYIVLNPTKGGVGTFVIVTGVGFSFSATTCSLSSPTSGSFITFPSCAIFDYGNGTRQPVGSFNVGNVAVGFYTVRLTANTGDFAQAVFNVTQVFVPTLAITPPDGPRGTIVKVTGTGFRTADTSCQLTSLTSIGTGADPSLITSPTCSMSSGTVTAQFTVGTNANFGSGTLARAVNVTGSSGDTAGINFVVDQFPTIRSVPFTGPTGTSAYVSLTGGKFSSGDQGSCTITSAPGGLFATSNCFIQNSGNSLNGTIFVTSGSANGFYTITVKGSTGDSAFANFTAFQTATLVLSPANATNGATVTFTGTGFSITDTGCVVEGGYTVGSYPAGFTPSNLVVGSSTCSMSSRVATGSFVVGPSATTDKNWTIRVRGTPANDIPAIAVFNVTASVTVSPSSGSIGTVFNFAGAGFSSKATFCGLPSFYPAGSPKPLSGSCGIVSPNSGEVAGSFIPKNVAPGVYVINVGDQLGHNASTTFTLGTPNTQLTISPNVIIQPVSGQFVFVGISGSGFNGNDTTCTVTTYTGIVSTGACSISGGFASASLKVDSTVTPGLYLITVTGNYGDFASNYLSVGILTTMISTSTTTTSFTSSTATTTLTTSTSISSSLTTTTFTSTGATTIVFPQQTLTTVSGVTTVVSTVTGSTSFPTTGTTTTTQTVTLGQAIQRSISDELGLLGMLLLVVPILLRRLFN